MTEPTPVVDAGHNPRDLTKRDRVQVMAEGESLTHTSFADECDINNIMRRFREMGVFTHVNLRPPLYGDFSAVDDYQGALALVQDAHDRFMELPAAVRAACGNNPQLLHDFIADPENAEFLKEHGVLLDHQVDEEPEPEVTPLSAPEPDTEPPEEAGVTPTS